LPDGPTLCGWGRRCAPGREVVSEDLARVTAGAVLTRGLGRSYGDSALPPPGSTEVAGSRLANRVLAFDPTSGLLRAEAGLALRRLVELFLPRRWWPPVVPGTQYVTLGGLVAADVHGKNHHRAGSFGAHVRSLVLRTAGDEIVRCSREEHPDLFRATLGGMGLTGHLLEVEVALERIPSPWIWAESERIAGLDRFVAALREASGEWPFTVGWLDTLARGRRLGRGVLLKGRWATAAEAPAGPPAPKKRLAVPFVLPGWVLARPAVRLFNGLYFRRPLPRGPVHPESFFFPLDAIHHWNRIYGPRGFTQYQCVLPEAERPGATRRLLEELARRGAPSFLAVIKDFGAAGEGLLSFPRPGITLAIDLPIRDGTEALVDALNALLVELGGRIYLAKDAFTRRERFAAMEGERLARFAEVRRRWDPEGRLASAQSARLLGDRQAKAESSGGSSCA
jgi:decaprenylphospho-beta-D-ribofuranose 2-oxidase